MQKSKIDTNLKKSQFIKVTCGTSAITLVSLIITIIVLLVLAGVTISLTLGDRGIFSVAQSASEKQKIAEYIEQIDLARVAVFEDNMGEVTLDNLKAQIISDKIVTENQIVTADSYLKITTTEGYIFIVTIDRTEQITDEGDMATPPAVREGNIGADITNANIWTNQSKTVTLTNNVEGNFTVQYSLDSAKTWKDYAAPIEIHENTTICVALRNTIGERGNFGTVEVEKIDRVVPEVTSVTSSPTSVTFSAQDNASGIIAYKVTTNPKAPETDDNEEKYEEIENTLSIENKEVEIENQNTNYYIWVKDEAGNVGAVSTVKTTTQSVTKIEVTPSSASMIKEDILTLSATVLPTNAYVKDYTWDTSDSSVATVSQEGVVTAVATGTCDITATSTYGENGEEVVGTCSISVTNPVKTVTLSLTEAKIKVGENVTLTASTTPTYPDDATITWNSSNSGIASVSGGVVTGVSTGSCNITATSANGIVATCNVKVKANANYGTSIQNTYSTLYTTDYPNGFTLTSSRGDYPSGNYTQTWSLISAPQNKETINKLETESTNRAKVTAGNNTYSLTKSVKDRWLGFFLTANSYGGIWPVSNWKLNFEDGVSCTIANAVSNGYIEPLVICYGGNLYSWNVLSTAMEVLSGGSSSSGSYGTLCILLKVKDKSQLLGVSFYATSASTRDDGLTVYLYDEDYEISISQIK